MKTIHTLSDYILINYLIHWRKAHPCSPIFIGDYLHILKEISPPYEGYKNNSCTSTSDISITNEEIHFPSPCPLVWGDGNVNTVKIINLHNEAKIKQNLVLWVHGFLMDDPLINFWASRAIKKIAKTLESRTNTSHLLFQLPLHYNRKLHFKGTKIGGEWLFQESPLRMLEVINSSVAEIHAFVSWWLDNFEGKITIVGISLGGAITGWLPVIQDFERRVHLILFVPAIDLYNSFLRSPLVQPLRKAIISLNDEPELVNRVLHKWTPIYHPSKWDENIKVIGGNYDALLPLQGIGWASNPSPWKEQPIGNWEKVWVKSIPYSHASWSLPYIGIGAQNTLAKAITETFSHPEKHKQ